MLFNFLLLEFFLGFGDVRGCSFKIVVRIFLEFFFFVDGGLCLKDMEFVREFK